MCPAASLAARGVPRTCHAPTGMPPDSSAAGSSAAPPGRQSTCSTQASPRRAPWARRSPCLRAQPGFNGPRRHPPAGCRRRECALTAQPGVRTVWVPVVEGTQELLHSTPQVTVGCLEPGARPPHAPRAQAAAAGSQPCQTRAAAQVPHTRTWGVPGSPPQTRWRGVCGRLGLQHRCRRARS